MPGVGRFWDTFLPVIVERDLTQRRRDAKKFGRNVENEICYFVIGAHCVIEEQYLFFLRDFAPLR